MSKSKQPISQPLSQAVIPTAYSYQRFSSPAQADGDSTRRQLELRDNWLKKSNAVLDTKLTMKDEGVSAFTGQHRGNPDRHALAAFLKLVELGRIERGSYLIMESLDRLTREDIQPALLLFLSLLQAGIRVVQLLPVEQVYDSKSETMAIMMAIFELTRGNSESRMKSERVGRAWAEKKKRASATGEVLTKVCPAWIRVEEGRYVLIRQKASIVRKVFALAVGGYGLSALTKKLNTDNVSPIARGEYWARSYVAKILANRGCFGEYQPCKGHAGPNRKPDGPPIPNYYPAVVTEEQWHAAQAAMASRKNKGGRPSKRVNIFAGLMKDARDGGPLQIVNKGGKTHGPAFVSYKAVHGIEGAKYVSFPRDMLEWAILKYLKEVSPKDILPNDEPAIDVVSTLTGRLTAIESRIAKIQASLTATDDDVAPLVKVLRDLEMERLSVTDELSSARRAAATPLSEGWGETRTLLEALEKADDSESVRIRLRVAIRRIVERIVCLFVDRKGVRLAAVQMEFFGGSHRLYMIWHKRGHGSGNAEGNRPSSWDALSTSFTPNPNQLNLRRKKDVQALDKVLSLLDVSNLKPASEEE